MVDGRVEKVYNPPLFFELSASDWKQMSNPQVIFSQMLFCFLKLVVFEIDLSHRDSEGMDLTTDRASAWYAAAAVRIE
jgi:hypothetical protein